MRAQDALESNAELVSRYGRFRQFWMVLYESGKPKSGVNFQVFRIPEHKATTIHICYIFTAKDSRGKGYASELLERIDSLGADAVFIEVDDPKKMPEEVMEESIRCSGITPAEWVKDDNFGAGYSEEDAKEALFKLARSGTIKGENLIKKTQSLAPSKALRSQGESAPEGPKLKIK